MDTNKNLPVALFNGAILTTNGIYSINDIDLEKAKQFIKINGFISAIGHEATAEILSELLGVDIPMNRIEFQQQIGQLAIVFKLNHRPPEGAILNKEEILNIGYSLKVIKRLE